jgi:transposase
LLTKWKRRYRILPVEDGRGAGLGKSELEEMKAENRRLKRELTIAQQERDILKKAISIFSKNQG